MDILCSNRNFINSNNAFGHHYMRNHVLLNAGYCAWIKMLLMLQLVEVWNREGTGFFLTVYSFEKLSLNLILLLCISSDTLILFIFFFFLAFKKLIQPLLLPCAKACSRKPMPFFPNDICLISSSFAFLMCCHLLLLKTWIFPLYEHTFSIFKKKINSASVFLPSFIGKQKI